jgi:prophage regulatory protein
MDHSILRLPQVRDATGLGRSTIYALVADGRLTPPVRLSERAVGWPQCEISAINAARIAGKSDEEVRQLVVRLEAARKVA